jgi:hypothetical protein
VGSIDAPLTQRAGAETILSNVGFESQTPAFVGKRQTQLGSTDSPLYLTPESAVSGITSWLPETPAFVGKKQTQVGNVDAPLIQVAGSQTGRNPTSWDAVTPHVAIDKRTPPSSVDYPEIQYSYPNLGFPSETPASATKRQTQITSAETPVTSSVAISGTVSWLSETPGFAVKKQTQVTATDSITAGFPISFVVSLAAASFVVVGFSATIEFVVPTSPGGRRYSAQGRAGAASTTQGRPAADSSIQGDPGTGQPP